MPKKSGRHSLRTYFKLTLGAVLLVGLNYVFTKLFDLLYGKFDAGYFIGVAIPMLDSFKDSLPHSSFLFV